MNPLTNVKNIQKLNQRELELGVIGKKSWHDEYKDSAWVFIGGLPYDLTEGDIVCVFSQYGEIVNINLVRDKATGKSKGFAFLCYEDQRSTVLAVDNLNSIKLLGRIIRVDHVSDYKKPKEKGDEDEVTLQLRADGCAPQVQANSQMSSELSEEPLMIRPPPNAAKTKKAKKDKKKKKKKKKMKVTVKVERKSDSDSSSSSSTESSDSEDERHRRKRKLKAAAADHLEKLKREKEDSGYDKALFGHRKSTDHSGREHGYDGDRRHDRRDTGSPDRSSDRHRDGTREQRHRDEQSSRGWSRDVGGTRDDRSDYRHSDRDRHRDEQRDRHRDTGHDEQRERHRDRADDRRHR